MKLIFMGTPDFAVASLEALYDAGYEIAVVFTQPDKPSGRGYKVTPPPVKTLALSHGTPVYQPQSLKKDDGTYLGILREIAPDCIVVAAYGKILPPSVLELPRYGCVNVHGSLLPRYRGAAPIQHAVLNGDKTTGITTMLMNDGIDTGDMLLVSETEIGENETSADLFERLAVMGGELIVKTLRALEAGEIVPKKQDEAAATHAPMLSKELCGIEFSASAYDVHRKICGLSDWPCATMSLDGKRIKVYRSEIVSNAPQTAAPGTVIDAENLTVACGNGAVRLVEIQAEGAKRMKASEYLRGHPIPAGSIFR
ncbi:MAG: methionyl-tRNA formyltransferase [Oscillospiraceae bacterium]